ncbi:hypothetical protein FA13DRAFT_1806513 [Coprinellus micaceus]|uniref:Uncharacterized protein n=1 Tax=Coprinellus micaceus TaxID=71717 RepID=A0A4Y7RLQ6_COPMI|nr:hypothetical protein FA13DRAFT_1806513 [Coprinellus micaceus]
MPGTPGILHAVPTTPPTTPGAGQQHIPVQVIAAPVPIPAAQHRSSSKPSPRGPRTRGGGSSSRRPTYPGGYTPYQAMAFPPPQLYFQGTPPTPTSAAMPTATPQQQQQPQFIQYVPVQVLPGAFKQRLLPCYRWLNPITTVVSHTAGRIHSSSHSSLKIGEPATPLDLGFLISVVFLLCSDNIAFYTLDMMAYVHQSR